MAAQKVRILCLGDSLTAGYSGFGAIYHPYSEKLQQMIAMALPEYEIEIETDGVSGDLVQGGFFPRMEKNFRNGQTFDWTIVLGGTNDISYANIEPEDTFAACKKVWNLPLVKGSKVLAMTVPEVGVGSERLREAMAARRNTLNSLIKGYQRRDFHVFDLHDAVPYFTMSEADRERYWDDGVHFTSDGYDLIGRKLGLALVSLLMKDKGVNGPPKRRVRKFKDDDLSFDEEVGDPTSIDQGYIIVRRKDLE